MAEARNSVLSTKREFLLLHNHETANTSTEGIRNWGLSLGGLGFRTHSMLGVGFKMGLGWSTGFLLGDLI